MDKKYSNSYDRISKIITFSTIILLVVTAFTVFYFGKSELTLTHKTLISLLFVLTVIVSWALHPVAYVLTPKEISIQRPMGQINLPMESIQSVRLLDKDELKGSIRVFGSGGLFGFYGRFYNKQLGKHRLQITNREEMVLIETEKQKYVISPDTKESFLRDYEKIKAKA